MVRAKTWAVLIPLLLLLLPISSATAGPALGVWRDINPTAYISPPANPELHSVYMLSSNEGWAVGDSWQTTNGTTGLPAIFHYDGSTWNLAPAPKFLDFPFKQTAYNLTSVSFGPPDSPINSHDGWAVGFNLTTDGSCPATSQCASVALHWDGITWRPQEAGFANPYAGPLWSTFMVGSTDVWAVGQNQPGTAGVFWHWTGIAGLAGGWTLAQPPVTGTIFYSVFMVNPTEGWAVGSQTGAAVSNIYHYTGGSWNPLTTPVPGVTLRSLFMLSPTMGWAVGDNGIIVQYSGGSWSGPVSPGTTSSTLYSIFMVSLNEGWAFGTSGTILHYSGGTWTNLPINSVPVSPLSNFRLRSGYFNSATDGWAVGTAGVILRYDGTNYGTVTSPTINNFTSISFGPPLAGPITPNDGWAVGNASSRTGGEPTIYHWNGFMWTRGVSIGTQNDLNSVFMISGNDVWAVGGGVNPTATCAGTAGSVLCPVILHFTGGTWNTVTPPPGNYRLRSIFMVSSTEGWAVGQIAGNTGIITHYTTTGGVGSWSTYPPPTSPAPLPALNSVFMLGQTEGWAVGDNATILHYLVSGGVGSWNSVPISGTPTLSKDANLTSVFMLNPTSGWAVGGIQHRAATPSGESSPYSAGPVILYWDGIKWTQVATPTIPGGISPIGYTSATLKSIYCSASNDCWVAGLPGKLLATLFHWDGFAWSHVTLSPALIGQDVTLKGVPPFLSSVYMTSPNNGWVVGSSPGFAIGSGVTTHALSTILRYSPYGGLLTVTSTSTLETTVTTSMTYVTTSATATSFLHTNVTVTYTGSTTSRPSGIPGFPLESIIAGAIVGMISLMLLRRRRSSRGA